MSKATFFSNTLILVDNMENDIVSSLANTRQNNQRTFSVPRHSVDTNNLLVFVDGGIKIRGEHYEDVNSYEIRFFNPVSVSSDFHSMVIKTGTEGMTSTTVIDMELQSNEF